MRRLSYSSGEYGRDNSSSSAQHPTAECEDADGGRSGSGAIAGNARGARRNRWFQLDDDSEDSESDWEDDEEDETSPFFGRCALRSLLCREDETRANSSDGDGTDDSDGRGTGGTGDGCKCAGECGGSARAAPAAGGGGGCCCGSGFAPGGSGSDSGDVEFPACIPVSGMDLPGVPIPLTGRGRPPPPLPGEVNLHRRKGWGFGGAGSGGSATAGDEEEGHRSRARGRGSSVQDAALDIQRPGRQLV